MAFHKDLFFYIPPIFLYSYLHSFIFFASLHPPFGRAGVGFWHGFPGVGIFNT